jgi:hypothetical protein
MVPNADAKGLRVERLDLKSSGVINRYRYSLMLTQVVDKHEYIQGVVNVSVAGIQAGQARSYSLNELDASISGEIRFRFRYFQNIEGELTLPEGFTPTETVIAAQPSGRSAKDIEKTFAWLVREG